MNVITYGTRGSVPVAHKDKVRFGGNTTCVRVLSDCLPQGMALVIDGGTGFCPLSRDLLKQGVTTIKLLFTHYHADHTQGIPLAPHTHKEGSHLSLVGPREHSKGPLEIMRDLMTSPHFPVDFAKVEHRFSFFPIEHVGTQVIVIHPQGGFHILDVHQYRSALAEGEQLPLGGKKFNHEECMVIWMHRARHPECTVSYRFEEKPTGKVFVFLTDHENTDAIPNDLLEHVTGADLLIQDGQYGREQYEKQTGGWGHGTPDYCARLALAAKVKRLGITHHDPAATDADIDGRVAEANEYAARQGHPEFDTVVYACMDYMEHQV